MVTQEILLTLHDYQRSKMETATMADISNKQVIDALTGLIKQTEQRLNERMVTKEDLAQLEARMASKTDLTKLEARMASKDDLAKLEHRLGRKLEAYQKANVQHHLATRDMIGGLTQQLGDMREGLGRAAGLTA